MTRPTPGRVARAVLSAKHPRIPGDPDHIAETARLSALCRCLCLESHGVFPPLPARDVSSRGGNYRSHGRYFVGSSGNSACDTFETRVSGCRHGETFSTASGRLCRHREVSRVPCRTRGYAEGHAPRSGKESTVTRGPPGRVTCPGPGPAAGADHAR